MRTVKTKNKTYRIFLYRLTEGRVEERSLVVQSYSTVEGAKKKARESLNSVYNYAEIRSYGPNAIIGGTYDTGEVIFAYADAVRFREAVPVSC